MIPKNRVVSSGGACSQIPQDGLIASYLLQGTAEDETGTYNGTETSMTYAYDDKKGIVGSFNGSTSKITIPSFGTLFNYSSLWTVSFTAVDIDNKASNYILGFTNSIGNNGLGVRLNPLMILSSKSNGSAGNIYSAQTPIVQPSNGDMVTLVKTSSTTVDLYINGSFDTTFTLSLSGSGNTKINAIGNYETMFLNGLLSNLYIYNRVLTAQEITDIYNLEKYQHNNALDNGLIAYYPLDGNSLDNAINQKDGTDTNVTYPTDAELGVVAEYDGTAYNIVPTGVITAADVFTLPVWFKTTASGIFHYITINAYDAEYFISLNTDNKLYMGVYATTWSFLTSVNTYNDGNWHLVVLQYDRTTATMNIDKSTEIITATGASGDMRTLSRHSLIGAGTNGSIIGHFNGRISKARFYNRILSDKEIEWLYDYEKPNSTECIANSTIDNPDPFEDGSGIALYKMDGNANDTTGVYDGTPTSITYADGEFGQCAVFNGSTSNISTTPITHPATFAISFWSKNYGITETYGIVLDARNTTSDNFYIVYTTNTTLQFQIRNGTAATTYDASSTQNVKEFWTLEYDGVNMIVSKNGTVINTTPCTHTVAISDIMMGAYNADGTTNSLNGNIEQVRYFNRALTVDERTILTNERKV